MTDTIKEQLSAFLDGELPETETTLLLKRLGRDDELKSTLSRYSLIGAALRADGEVSAARHVASRVRAAIAIEPALPSSPGRAAAARLLRPLGGLGVAAGVAAAALLVTPQWLAGQGAVDAPVQQLALETPLAAEPSAAAVATLAAPAPETPPPSYTTPPAPAGGVHLGGAQLASYLVAHSEFASPLARRTVIVAPPEEQGPETEATAVAGTPAEAGVR